eukprot:UN23702
MQSEFVLPAAFVLPNTFRSKLLYHPGHSNFYIRRSRVFFLIIARGT